MNNRIILDKPNSKRSEKSTIISMEVQKYSIDVPVWDEARFAENGSIREDTGFTFYWTEKTSTERSEFGVAFVMRNDLLNMSEDPKPVSRRLITLRFPLVDIRCCILIVAFALWLTAMKNKLFLRPTRPDGNKIVLLGAFNAWVGQ